MTYPSRQTRGAAKMANRLGQKLPYWMLCQNTLDPLAWPARIGKYWLNPEKISYVAVLAHGEFHIEKIYRA